eukprot:g4135.t1
MPRFQVVVRVRPLLPCEKPKIPERTIGDTVETYDSDASETKTTIVDRGSAVEVSQGGKRIQTIGAQDRKRAWSFDRVYGPSASQEDIYLSVKSSIHSVANGINATIFAYGQTGSGKTYTMMGHIERGETESGSGSRREKNGIFPRALESLFDALRKKENVETYQVRASFLQIYNNKLYDLLCDPKRQRSLMLREITRNGIPEVVVNNASEVRVSCVNDVLRLLDHGNAARAIRGTSMNASSSRSHVIMQLSVEVHCFAEKELGANLQRKEDDGPVAEEGDWPDRTRRRRLPCRRRITKARLNLIDLAGSEKWDTSKDAAMEDGQARELTHINSSLSTLGTVIRVLASRGDARSGGSEESGDACCRHVPYRESRLTFLLRDALGGNSFTTVIATVSPTVGCCRETVSTLKFAQHATRVRSNIRINEIVDDSEQLRRANVEIGRLKQLLRKRGRANLRRLRRQLDTLQRANSKLRDENSKLRVRLRSGGRRRAGSADIPRRHEGDADVLSDAAEKATSDLDMHDGDDEEVTYDDDDDVFEDDEDDDVEIDVSDFDDETLCCQLLLIRDNDEVISDESVRAIAVAKEIELASSSLRKIARRRQEIEAKLALRKSATGAPIDSDAASDRGDELDTEKSARMRKKLSCGDSEMRDDSAAIWAWLKKRRIGTCDAVARELDELGVSTASDLLDVTSDDVARVASRMNRVQASRFLRGVRELVEMQSKAAGDDAGVGGVAALRWSLDDVDLEIRIFLHRYNQWFSGVVVDYDNNCGGGVGGGGGFGEEASAGRRKGMHCVRYEASGSAIVRDSARAAVGRWHDLSVHPVQVVGRARVDCRRRRHRARGARRRRKNETSKTTDSLHRSVVDAYRAATTKSAPAGQKERSPLPSIRPSTGRRLLMELEAKLGGEEARGGGERPGCFPSSRGGGTPSGAGVVSPSRYRA